MNNVDFYNENLALEEMRLAFQEHSNASNVLDQKASVLLNSASLILGLFGILQLTLPKAGQSPLYWIAIMLALALYLGIILISTNALLPRTYQAPIRADWNVLSENILMLEPRDALLKLLSGYVEYIPQNRKLNKQKACRIRIAAWLLAFIIIILVLSSLLAH